MTTFLDLVRKAAQEQKSRFIQKHADKALEGSRAKRKRGEITPGQLTKLAARKVKTLRAMNEAGNAWTEAFKQEREKLGIS